MPSGTRRGTHTPCRRCRLPRRRLSARSSRERSTAPRPSRHRAPTAHHRFPCCPDVDDSVADRRRTSDSPIRRGRPEWLARGRTIRRERVRRPAEGSDVHAIAHHGCRVSNGLACGAAPTNRSSLGVKRVEAAIGRADVHGAGRDHWCGDGDTPEACSPLRAPAPSTLSWFSSLSTGLKPLRAASRWNCGQSAELADGAEIAPSVQMPTTAATRLILPLALDCMFPPRSVARYRPIARKVAVAPDAGPHMTVSSGSSCTACPRATRRIRRAGWTASSWSPSSAPSCSQQSAPARALADDLPSRVRDVGRLGGGRHSATARLQLTRRHPLFVTAIPQETPALSQIVFAGQARVSLFRRLQEGGVTCSTSRPSSSSSRKFQQIKPQIQQAFPDVPEQELSKAQSNPDQLVSTIEQKTGQPKAQIEQKLTQLASRV